MLCQTQGEQEHFVAYYSCQLSKQERSYSTTEREALAVVAAVKEFYLYLYGHEFTLVTDHNPLVTLTNLKDATGHLARWIMYLQQFNYSFVYRPGKSHTNADSLSRSGPTLQLIASIANTLPQVNVKARQQEDKEIADTIKALEHSQLIPNRYKHQATRLVVKGGVLYRRLLGLGDSIDSVNIAIVSLLSWYDIANHVITIETTCVS